MDFIVFSIYLFPMRFYIYEFLFSISFYQSGLVDVFIHLLIMIHEWSWHLYASSKKDYCMRRHVNKIKSFMNFIFLHSDTRAFLWVGSQQTLTVKHEHAKGFTKVFNLLRMFFHFSKLLHIGFTEILNRKIIFHIDQPYLKNRKKMKNKPKRHQIKWSKWRKS